MVHRWSTATMRKESPGQYNIVMRKEKREAISEAGGADLNRDSLVPHKQGRDYLRRAFRILPRAKFHAPLPPIERQSRHLTSPPSAVHTLFIPLFLACRLMI